MVIVNIKFVSSTRSQVLEKYVSDKYPDNCCLSDVQSLEHTESEVVGFKKFHQKKREQRRKEKQGLDQTRPYSNGTFKEKSRQRQWTWLAATS